MKQQRTRPRVTFVSPSEAPVSNLALVRGAPIARAATITDAAAKANAAAAAHAFADYRQRLAAHTVRAHDSDIATFATFLVASGVSTPGDLANVATAWQGMSWGLVAAFVQWQVAAGYAVSSINRRLSTVKSYAQLAAKAGTLTPEDYLLIKGVAGYQQTQGKRIDAKRDTTRIGAKKAAPVDLTPDQAAQLKDQADPRDRLLMCILIDHGLRVGEATLLTPKHFDLRRGLLVNFYRPKVDKYQTHRLTPDTQAAAVGYLDSLPRNAPVFPGERRIRTIVKQLGAALGIETLSPHDARHRWATAAIEHGTDLKSLQDAGGWNSPAMPLRYAASAEIANEGVKLS